MSVDFIGHAIWLNEQYGGVFVGELRGNAFQYALVALWQGFLVILTAGLWWPRMQMRLSGYLVSNASLVISSGVEQRSGLFSAWLLAWSVGLFAIVCGLGWMSFRVAGPESGDGLGFAEPLLLTASLISGFACFLLFCAYQVALVRAKAVSLSLDDLFVFSSVQVSHCLAQCAHRFGASVRIYAGQCFGSAAVQHLGAMG